MGLSVTSGSGGNLGRVRHYPWTDQSIENVSNGFRGSIQNFVPSAASFSLTIPTTIGSPAYTPKEGDLALLVTHNMANNAAQQHTIPAGSGWALAGAGYTGTSYTYHTWYYKQLTAADLGATTTWTGVQTAGHLYALFIFEPPRVSSTGVRLVPGFNVTQRSVTSTAYNNGASRTLFNFGSNPGAYRAEVGVGFLAAAANSAYNITTTTAPTITGSAPYDVGMSLVQPVTLTTSGAGTSTLGTPTAMATAVRYNGQSHTNWVYNTSPNTQYDSFSSANVTWTVPHLVTGNASSLQFTPWTTYYDSVPINAQRLEVVLRPSEEGFLTVTGTGVANRRWLIQFAKGPVGAEQLVASLPISEVSSNLHVNQVSPYIVDAHFSANDRMSYRFTTGVQSTVSSAAMIVGLVGA